MGKIMLQKKILTAFFAGSFFCCASENLSSEDDISFDDIMLHQGPILALIEQSLAQITPLQQIHHASTTPTKITTPTKKNPKSDQKDSSNS